MLPDEQKNAVRRFIFDQIVRFLREGPMGYVYCFYAADFLAAAAVLLEMDRRRTGGTWNLSRIVHRMTVLYLEKPQNFNAARLEECLGQQTDQLLEDVRKPCRGMNPYVEQALMYMEKNYMSDLSLESLSEQTGITQFYLSRLFKQEKNQNFSEIITDIRISRALHLLPDSTLSIQNISSSVGYSVKYFYQAFRNTVGISQKDFREMIFAEEGQS